MRNAVLSLESIDWIIFTGGGGKRLHHVAQKLMPDLAGIMVLDTESGFLHARFLRTGRGKQWITM